VGLVRERPELIPNAVEEVVRLASPIRAFTRFVTEDAEIAGVPIPQGARVMVMYASANRDERKFADPDRFDVTRDVHDHLGFGSGVHMCMGMHLARLEIVSLLQSLARRVNHRAGRRAGGGDEQHHPRLRLAAGGGAGRRARRGRCRHSGAAERETLTVRVARAPPGAQDIVAIELESADGTPLPPFEPGAHVDVQVTGGLLRQYSLSNDPAARGRYRLGVLLDPKSRGGSAAVHAGMQVGQVLQIGRPRNHFPLRLDAAHTVLFAGGIGITPILAMAHALHAAGRSFELHYCGRTRRGLPSWTSCSGSAARAAAPGRRHPQRSTCRSTACWPRRRPDRHLYVCGPNGFMDFVTHAAQRLGWAEDTVHLERFGAEVNTDGAPFTVVAARSQVTFDVQPGERIAEKLIEHGIAVRMSCQSGVCGTCVTRVIDGMPDHRDHVQTASEKASQPHHHRVLLALEDAAACPRHLKDAP
jgi:ferredoxin-NADP reductase